MHLSSQLIKVWQGMDKDPANLLVQFSRKPLAGIFSRFFKIKKIHS
jgi:hypothetical protein